MACLRAVYPKAHYVTVNNLQPGTTDTDYDGSTMSGVPLNFDELGIDVLLAGTQKAFALPPGTARFTRSRAASASLGFAHSSRPAPCSSRPWSPSRMVVAMPLPCRLGPKDKRIRPETLRPRACALLC